MKIILIVAITIAILGAYAFSQISSERQVEQLRSSLEIQQSQFVCHLASLTPEQQERHQELSKMLSAAVASVQELPDGLEFEFAPDPYNYQALTELTSIERSCCPFFEVSVRPDRETGTLWWRLTGRDGVKQFIHAEFSSWIPPSTGTGPITIQALAERKQS